MSSLENGITINLENQRLNFKKEVLKALSFGLLLNRNTQTGGFTQFSLPERLTGEG